jgi:hypothetical protein
MRRFFTIAGATVLAMGALAGAVYRSLHPRSLPVPPVRALEISDVRVYRPGIGVVPHQTIEIIDGRIAAIRSASAGDAPPVCRDCVVMPGLIDAHVHWPPRIAIGNQPLFALLFLHAGVTTVRDVGESDGSIAALAGRLNRGQLVGPRVVRCGPVLDGPDASWGNARVLTTDAEARRVVDSLALTGVECVKVYNELSPEAYAGVRAAAAMHGLRVMGHIPHSLGLQRVQEFEAQHLTGVPYAVHGRAPSRSDFRDADFVELDEVAIDTAVALHVRNGIAVLPTLANARLRLVASDSLRFPPPAGAKNLPRFWGPAWNSGSVASHPEGAMAIGERQGRLTVGQRITRRLYDAGVPILAGTDVTMPWVVPGESLLLELEELSVALGGPDRALTAATIVNARALGDSARGTIIVGGPADLLLLPRDPSTDLSALRDWRMVLVAGRRYDRARVDEWVAQYRAHFRGGWYGGVMDLGLRLTQPSYRTAR